MGLIMNCGCGNKACRPRATSARVAKTHRRSAWSKLDASPIALAAQRLCVDRIYRQLSAFSANGQAGLLGLIAALVLGDQAAIDRADWNVFHAPGVAHLVAISGFAYHHVRVVLGGRGWMVVAAFGADCVWRFSNQAFAGRTMVIDTYQSFH